MSWEKLEIRSQNGQIVGCALGNYPGHYPQPTTTVVFPLPTKVRLIDASEFREKHGFPDGNLEATIHPDGLRVGNVHFPEIRECLTVQVVRES